MAAASCANGFRRYELLDINVARSFGDKLLKIFFLEDYKCPGFNLKPFPHFFIRNFVAALGIDHVLLDALFRFVVKNVKSDRLILDCGIQLDRDLRRVEL